MDERGSAHGRGGGAPPSQSDPAGDFKQFLRQAPDIPGLEVGRDQGRWTAAGPEVITVTPGATRSLLVNGLPATGKTTVCRELQRQRHEHGELWLHVPLDVHQTMLPENVRLTDEQYQVGVSAMYRSVEGLAAVANVILELVVRDDPVVREIYTGIESTLARAGCTPTLVTLLSEEPTRRRRGAHRAAVIGEPSFTSSLDAGTVQHSDLVLPVDDLDAAAVALRLSDLLDRAAR